MPTYKLEIFEPPDERLKHRREFDAANDEAAIKWADEFWNNLVADPNIKLDRYVLYEHERKRIVRERRST